MKTTNDTNLLPVPGPARGTLMTKEYVRAVGRMADIWRWPLANPGLLPADFNGVTLLADHASRDDLGPSPDADFAARSLDKEPMMMQLDDFGDRFWVFPLYDQRSDVFSPLGTLANASDRHSRP